eukprot:Skav230687  [mRNA]  locus=scaffold2202:144081:144305:+ [translate_table: standard]
MRAVDRRDPQRDPQRFAPDLPDSQEATCPAMPVLSVVQVKSFSPGARLAVAAEDYHHWLVGFYPPLGGLYPFGW